MTPEQKNELIAKLEEATKASGEGQHHVATMYVQDARAALYGMPTSPATEPVGAADPTAQGVWDAINAAKTYFANLTPGYAHYEPLAEISAAFAGHEVANRAQAAPVGELAVQRWVKVTDSKPPVMNVVRIGYTTDDEPDKLLEMRASWDGEEWATANRGSNVQILDSFYQVQYWLYTPEIKGGPALDTMPVYSVKA